MLRLDVVQTLCAFVLLFCEAVSLGDTSRAVLAWARQEEEEELVFEVSLVRFPREREARRCDV